MVVEFVISELQSYPISLNLRQVIELKVSGRDCFLLFFAHFPGGWVIIKKRGVEQTKRVTNMFQRYSFRYGQDRSDGHREENVTPVAQGDSSDASKLC